MSDHSKKKSHPAFPDGVDPELQTAWLDRLEDLTGYMPMSVCYGHDDAHAPRAKVQLIAALSPEESEFEATALQAHIFSALWTLLTDTRIELCYNSAVNGYHEYRGGWQPLNTEPPEIFEGCEFYLTLEYAFGTPGNQYVGEWFEDVLEALETVLGTEGGGQSATSPGSGQGSPPSGSSGGSGKSVTSSGETIH